MPPKKPLSLKKSKSKSKKGKKKGKKAKPVFEAPPLHELTDLYNGLRSKLMELRKVQGRARKKRVEGWFVTREMLSLQHDNEVYHDYLKDKMDRVKELIEDITLQLVSERDAVDKAIRERIGEYDKRYAEFKYRMNKGEVQLAELKTKLIEFDPAIKKLQTLLQQLKELQTHIPAAELDASLKTRHLKNQFLEERTKLHTHLENELYKLIINCRAYLMPILSQHMNLMELENRCNRWDLNRLDLANGRLTTVKQLLLEKRNRLNMERPYLSIDWAFNKLASAETRKREERERRHRRMKRTGSTDECELATDFKQFLNKKLSEERLRQNKESKAKKRTEERRKKMLEIAEKAAAKMGKKIDEMELIEEWNEDMEYYIDEQGNLAMAPKGRMKKHKSILKEEEEEEEESEESESESSSSETESLTLHETGSEGSESLGLSDDLDLSSSSSSSESGSGSDEGNNENEKKTNVKFAPSNNMIAGSKAMTGAKSKGRSTTGTKSKRGKSKKGRK